MDKFQTSFVSLILQPTPVYDFALPLGGQHVINSRVYDSPFGVEYAL